MIERTAVYVNRDGLPTVPDASADMLAALLGVYENEVCRRGVEPNDVLQPGLDAEEIKALLATRGLEAPDEVIAWFSWHNGSVPGPGGKRLWAVMPGVQLADLEELLGRYDVSRESTPTRFPRTPDQPDMDWGAPAGWLQLEPKNTGYAVECVRGGATVPEVRAPDAGFTLLQEPPRSRALSLCTLVTWWLEGLQAGAYQLTEDRRWETEETLLPALQREMWFV